MSTGNKDGFRGEVVGADECWSPLHAVSPPKHWASIYGACLLCGLNQDIPPWLSVCGRHPASGGPGWTGRTGLLLRGRCQFWATVERVSEPFVIVVGTALTTTTKGARGAQRSEG